jgi:hypothetical protein
MLQVNMWFSSRRAAGTKMFRLCDGFIFGNVYTCRTVEYVLAMYFTSY